MLTLLLAATLLAEPISPADMPNASAYAKLPLRLQTAWVVPSFFGNQPIVYAQAPAMRQSGSGLQSYRLPGGGTMISGTLSPGMSIGGFSYDDARRGLDLSRALGVPLINGRPMWPGTSRARTYGPILGEAYRRQQQQGQ